MTDDDGDGGGGSSDRRGGGGGGIMSFASGDYASVVAAANQGIEGVSKSVVLAANAPSGTEGLSRRAQGERLSFS